MTSYERRVLAKRNKEFKAFIKKLGIKQATSALKVLVSNRPSDFGYHGEKDLFGTWAMLPYGTTTRDDRDTMGLSNQEVIKADLERINKNHVEILRSNHWACGWVEQLIAKVLHHGKPTRVGLRVLYWVEQLNEYPVADENDYQEREDMATDDDLEYYLDDFRKELAKYLGIELDSIGTKKQSEHFLYYVYREDCGYRGRDNAWAGDEAIERFTERSNGWNMDQDNPFLLACKDKLKEVAS